MSEQTYALLFIILCFAGVAVGRAIGHMIIRAREQKK